jgi:hypothetical protein
MITVVSVKGLNRPEQRQAVTYVGRRFAGWPASPLGNPFKGPDAVNKFAGWLLFHPRRKELLAAVWEACERGAKPLGCWCVGTLAEPWVAKRGEELVCHAQCVAVQLLDMVETGQLPPAATTDQQHTERGS